MKRIRGDALGYCSMGQAVMGNARTTKIVRMKIVRMFVGSNYTYALCGSVVFKGAMINMFDSAY